MRKGLFLTYIVPLLCVGWTLGFAAEFSWSGNQSPALDPIGAKSVDEGQNLSFGVSASDPDGVTPALTAEGVPANVTFTDNGDGTGRFDFNPDLAQAGVYYVTFIASDASSADSEVVAIKVDAAGQASLRVSRIGSWSTGLSHTAAPARNRLLIFAVGYENEGAAPPIDSVFYGGQPLTYIVGEKTPASGYRARAELWYLDEAGIGAAATDLFTVFYGWEMPLQHLCAAAVYGNVNQANPVFDAAGDAVSASTPNPLTTTVNVVENGLSVATAFCGNDGWYTWNNGWIEGFDQTAGGTCTMSGADNQEIADGTSTASAEHSVPNRTAMVAVCLAPVISEPNQPPVLASIGPQSVDENQNLSFSVSASDPDGTIPLLMAEDVPPNATFTDSGNGTGRFDFNPDFTQAGIYHVTFIASDGSLADSEVVEITVNDLNHPPVFDPGVECYVTRMDTLEDFQLAGGNLEEGAFTTCYVRERESLELTVSASDADGDPVSISVWDAPPGARFEDRGDGSASLQWMPEFVGPYSSAQSPFELNFVAYDGSLSSSLEVLINVINVNRAPELILPESLQVAVDNRLMFQVRARDLDLEGVTIEALDLPPEASFDPGSGMFDWEPQLADTGLRAITFRATDLSGGSDSEEAQVRVLPPSTFDLNLGTAECPLGGTVIVPVNLVNSESIAGIEILIRFDPTIFTFLDWSKQGTRTQEWEYLSCREKTGGLYQLIKMVGIADFPNQTSVAPLYPDSGAIAYLRFRVTSDLNLSGLLAPLEFLSVDFTDNTLSTPAGQFVTRDRISLNPGGVLLDGGNTLVGDVNENGIPFEVGDAVKLAAYISGIARLSQQQLANSDVNQDGRGGTLSDLVFLIRHIVEDKSPPPGDGATTGEEVVLKVRSEESYTSVRLESELPIGGALLVLEGDNARIENVKLSPQGQGVELHTHQAGGQTRLLVISQEAQPLPAGDGYLLSFEAEGVDTLHASLADQHGELLSVKREYEQSALPPRVRLHQNHPNPFNPETKIKYSVEVGGAVQVGVRVYNVAGQLVKTLVDEVKSPGEYEVIWNGRNENDDQVASGVYFYRLQVSDLIETRKMVLLR
ncbi:MAG: T9SS type A sorting domain-containing protein [Candidatus Zixiibacteriota bacterium]|nr:MAG: T9SS type A sorting domain-containing protein [candidate division Zixibacteria bacterium]